MTRGRPGASFGGIVLKSSPPESLTVFRHCRDRTGLRIAEVTVRAGDWYCASARPSCALHLLSDPDRLDRLRA